MYEKFTDRARKVMQLANEEAHRFNHEYIGTEHILLALISEGSGVAANTLNNLDISLCKVRLEVEKIIQAGPAMCVGALPQTPRAKKVIQYAIEEARFLKCDYVGTEHLLLGVVREDEGVAAQVLMNLGLHLKTVRDEVIRILGHLPDWTDPGLVVDFVKHSDVVVLEEGNPMDPIAAIEHLPECARKIVAEFDSQVALLRIEKENAVVALDFESAASLRDLEYKLRKLRDEFLSHWPKR